MPELANLPETVNALRAELNGIAASPLWSKIWTVRGYDVGQVKQCIRNLIECARGCESDTDENAKRRFRAWAAFILDYANGRLTHPLAESYEGPVGPGMIFAYDEKPDAEPVVEEEGVSQWRETYYRYPDKSFKQAIVMFKHRFGFWPKSTWPLMPRNQVDRGRRISKVPYEKLIPDPKRQDEPSGPIPE